MARAYSCPRKINSSSFSRLACIWYAGTAAAMKIEAAAAKKISAASENPASERCLDIFLLRFCSPETYVKNHKDTETQRAVMPLCLCGFVVLMYVTVFG